MAFYTHVEQIGSRIYHRYIDDSGRDQDEVTHFSPTLYTETKDQDAPFRGFAGEYLKEHEFNNIWDAKQYIKEHKTMPIRIHGMENWWAQYIQRNYTGNIDWHFSKLKVVSIDIETRMNRGFPNTANPESEITAIALKVHGGKIYAFGTKGNQSLEVTVPDDATDDQKAILSDVKATWDSIRGGVEFTRCNGESELLMEFMAKWSEIRPHIVTGWNIEYFDMPYLINRMLRFFPIETVNRMSPAYGKKRIRDFISFKDGEFGVTTKILGVSIVDYLATYKKFTYKKQESYKLDYIAEVELKDKKVDYRSLGYRNLDDLWEKNPDLYLIYNIQDANLVERIDQKKNLLRLITYLAYKLHVRYEDTFFQVRMWDVFIYNRNMAKNIIIPPKERRSKDGKFRGAFVFPVKVGVHEWVVSFDLNSLYPHLIMWGNIGPDTLVDREEVEETLGRSIPMYDIDDLADGKVDLDYLKDANLAMTGNSQFFLRDKPGFLPGMMEELYAERAEVKKQQLAAEQEINDIKAILKSRGVS